MMGSAVRFRLGAPSPLESKIDTSTYDAGRRRSKRKPVLILLEDAHWADATSLELLNLAIERLRRLPILLLVTYRPEFDAPWQGLPEVTSLPLGKLERHQAEAVIECVTAGPKLPAEVAAQII